MKALTILAVFFILVSNSIAFEINVNGGVIKGQFKQNFGRHDKEFAWETKEAYKKINSINKEFDYPLKHVRKQNILTYVSGNSKSLDISGRPYNCDLFDFAVIDSVLNSIVNANLIPFIELNYIPECLAMNPGKIGAWGLSCISPPAENEDWEWFIRQIINHITNKYNTSNWNFGFWNEPDITEFWDIDIYGFSKWIEFYNSTQSAVLPIVLGGPETAGVHDLTEKWFNGIIQSPKYLTVHAYFKNPKWLFIKSVQIVNQYETKFGEFEGNVHITETAPDWHSYGYDFVQNEFCAAWIAAAANIFADAPAKYKAESILYCGSFAPHGNRGLFFQPDNDENSSEIYPTPTFFAMAILNWIEGKRFEVINPEYPVEKYSDPSDLTAYQFNRTNVIATESEGYFNVLVYNFSQYNIERQENYISIKINLNGYPSGIYEHYIVDKNHSNSFTSYEKTVEGISSIFKEDVNLSGIIELNLMENSVHLYRIKKDDSFYIRLKD